jgi:hypothetical protein
VYSVAFVFTCDGIIQSCWCYCLRDLSSWAIFIYSTKCVDTVILCSILVWLGILVLIGVDILSIRQLTVFDCIRCISLCY